MNEVEESAGLDQIESAETPESEAAEVVAASESVQAGSPEATPAIDLAGEVAGRLTGRLEELQRQLSRVEGRFDRGGQDAAAVREMRKEIGDLRNQLAEVGEIRKSLVGLDSIGELRDMMDLVARRTLEPDELADYERKREAARTAKKEADLAARADRAERALAHTLSTVRMPSANTPPAPTVPPEQDPEYIAAVQVLDQSIREADYNPEDPELQRRILEATGVDVKTMPKAVDRLNALLRGFQKVQAADLKALRAETAKAREDAAKAAEDAAKREAAAKEARERQAARGAVVTDRNKAGTGAKGYTTQRELEADYAAGRIDSATFRKHVNSLPY